MNASIEAIANIVGFPSPPMTASNPLHYSPSYLHGSANGLHSIEFLNPIGNVKQSEMMADQTREEVDAKIARAKAETSVEITRMEGKIDNLANSIGTKFDSLTRDVERARNEIKDSRFATMTTIIASAVAMLGVIVAIGIYGDTMFGRGVSTTDLARAVAKETIEKLKEGPNSN